jgi:small subunit ribosomal protein S20
MPNNPSSKKRLRQSSIRRLRNRSVRSKIRTRTRAFLSMESPAEAQGALSELYSALDRAARKRIIPKKAAARQKARLARHVLGLTKS